ARRVAVEEAHRADRARRLSRGVVGLLVLRDAAAGDLFDHDGRAGREDVDARLADAVRDVDLMEAAGDVRVEIEVMPAEIRARDAGLHRARLLAGRRHAGRDGVMRAILALARVRPDRRVVLPALAHR